MRKTVCGKLVPFQLTLLASFLLIATAVITPAVSQTESTTSSTTASENTGRDTSVYNGAGESVPVRKDAWTWYWDEKAHIQTDNSSGFWGDDAISNLFKNICNSFVVPFWNAAMEYDFIRAGLLLVMAGMLLGLGATFVMPKKQDTK